MRGLCMGTTTQGAFLPPCSDCGGAPCQGAEQALAPPPGALPVPCRGIRRCGVLGALQDLGIMSFLRHQVCQIPSAVLMYEGGKH